MSAARRALAALLIAAPVAAADAPDFDRGVRAGPYLEAARAEAGAVPPAEGREQKSPEGAVWVSVGRDDLLQPAGAGVGVLLGPPLLSSDRAAVFRVEPERLLRLAVLMHEKFGRCGGFFAHDAREEAEADLAPPPAASGGPYTLDQQAWVKPLAARVREEELRSTIETLAAYHNRYYQSETGESAARWLAERWRALARGVPGASVRLVAHGGWRQPSVALTLPGAERPEEVVVLGGHLDSISGWGGASARAPGADDNASGIAVLTEAVRLLGEAGFRPARTVEIIGYAAEEVGLRGSQEIAREHQRAGAKVAAVLQFDMTNFAGSGDRLFLLDDNVDPALTAFLGRLAEEYSGMPWSSTRCGYACSDHASWTRSGYPASAAFESALETMNRNLHTERDTLAGSGGDARHSMGFARLAVAFAAEIAKPAGSVTARK